MDGDNINPTIDVQKVLYYGNNIVREKLCISINDIITKVNVLEYF